MTEVTAVEVVSASNSPRKANNGETLISLVLDETGSMMSCYEPTISSVNDYLGSQKGQDGVCKVNLYTFSEISGGFGMMRSFSISADMQKARETGKAIRTVFEEREISEVGFLTKENYRPNGGTNLYDAIGTTIRRIEAQLAPQETEPNVLVVIVTDGGENASNEYNLPAIKTLIQQKESEGWTFVYLGANQDAFTVGASFGLSKGQTMTYSTTNMADTMTTLSAATASYRGLRGVGSTMNATVAKGFFDGDKGDENS